MQIASHLQSIVELIAASDVCEINAATGSGKSIGIPSALAKLGSKVFIAVPTTSAAVSLSSYQKNLLPSTKIGYAAEGDIKYDKDTLIVYATAGHLRRKMLSYFSNGNASPISFTDVLLVDEVHAGSVDNTVILSLWYYAYAKGVQVPKLVLASATPSPSILRLKIPRYEVNVETYPIDIQYSQKDFALDEGSLYTEIARLAANIHLTTKDNGSMLIFASGSNEVETIINLLAKSAAAATAVIIPAFGAMKQEEVQRIYQEVKGKRKIIVATNIAESAITIADLAIVIDSMLEKRAETSLTGGLRLATHLISKASAKQRSGRTGRTRAGTAYRMLTNKMFETLDAHRPEEINRVPIYEVVMELFAVGLDPGVLLGVDRTRIKSAIELLSSLAMITPEGVTELGQFAPAIPLGVRNAAVLYFWVKAGYPIYPGIVAVSLIDCFGPSYFWYPRKETGQTASQYQISLDQHYKKFFLPFAGRSDVDTFLNLWISMMDAVGGPTAQPSVISKWCVANSINNKKIREVMKIVRQVTGGLIRLGYKVEVGPFTRKGVMKALRPLLRNLYGDMYLTRRGSSYIHENTGKTYTLDYRKSINSFSSRPPRDLIGIIATEIEGIKSTVRMINCAITGTAKSKEELVTGSKATDALSLTTFGPGGNEGRGLIGSMRNLDMKDKIALLPLLRQIVGLNFSFSSADMLLELIIGLNSEGKPIKKPLMPESKLLEELKEYAIDVTRSFSLARTTSRAADIASLFETPPKISMYLDVGAAEGDITGAVVDYYGLKKDQAYATDILPMKGTEKYNFLQTDGDVLPFEANTFNFLTIFMAAHHFRQLGNMLDEIKRVSKPGAHIVIREHDVDLSYMSKIAWTTYFDFIHLCYAVYRNKEVTVEQWMFDYVNNYPYANYKSRDEWVPEFEKAGFNLVTTKLPEKDDVNFAFYQVYTSPIVDAYAAIIARHPDASLISIGEEPEIASLFPSTSPKLSITPDGLYFMTRPDEAAAIVSVIKQAFNTSDPKTLIVTDATAGMGGVTFGLAAAFGTVNAVDRDMQMITLLKANLDILGLSNVALYHFDYLEAMLGIAQNVIFIEPPVGGLSYETSTSIDVYLGDKSIAEVAQTAIKERIAQLLLIKLPNNFNFQLFEGTPGYTRLDLQRFQLAFIVIG